MTRIIPLLVTLAALLAGVAAVPADAAPRPRYYVDEASLPFEPLAGHEDSERQWGIYQRAGYRYEIPADWNGELVMWAHGFRGTEERLYFNPEEVPFRQYLLDNGYAWAASTYRENGYTVGVGATDTRRLANFFSRTVAEPERVYIAGASMGGHITAASIERFPFYYAGAMPVCGVLGDYQLFDFFLDFTVAAQHLGLGESQFPVDDDYVEVTSQEIKANLEAVPGGWPLVLNERGEALKQLTELRSGGDRPNFDEAWFFWNSIAVDFLFGLGTGDGTVGDESRIAIENIDAFYETDLVPGQSNDIESELNAEIARVKAQPGGRKLSPEAASPLLRGYIQIPVLTMHNLGDLFVPFSMETIYHDKVASKGNSDLLVQRAIRGSGHCGFTTAEYEQAFGDLVTWVETGERPEGDAVNDPAAVAADDFGCRFTDPAPGAHLFAAPCPEG